jgi:hypothetical protein
VSAQALEHLHAVGLSKYDMPEHRHAEAFCDREWQDPLRELAQWVRRAHLAAASAGWTVERR